jgi:hypothetical protein
MSVLQQSLTGMSLSNKLPPLLAPFSNQYSKYANGYNQI